MSQKTTIIAVVAVVAILAVAGAGVFFFMNNKSSDETYWYYLYFEDGNDKNGWYSATASNASDGFKNAMSDAKLDWEKSEWGYIAKINNNSGYNDAGWVIRCYIYSETDKAAQDGSAGSAKYQNGWKEFAGYDSTAHDGFKFYQANSNIWFLTPYLEGYASANPFSVTAWKDSGPFKDSTTSSVTQDYSYYLYFGADNAKNGWYTASATNASDGFTEAMKKAGIEWTKSAWGYIGSIDGNAGYNDAGWVIRCYIYSETDKAAQDGSAGSAKYQNGWKEFAGYDSTAHDGFKFYQANSNIWFLTPYLEGYASDNPFSVTSWKGTGPFA